MEVQWQPRGSRRNSKADETVCSCRLNGGDATCCNIQNEMVTVPYALQALRLMPLSLAVSSLQRFRSDLQGMRLLFMFIIRICT